MKHYMIGRNDTCWCGSGQKWKKCHFPKEPPASASSQTLSPEKLVELYKKRYHIVLKTKEQIAGIRQAGHLAAQILEATCAMAKAGVTTKELDQFAAELHKKAGAIPASLGYGHPPFPAGICTSINEVICHGIPENRALLEGDIVNIDVACILNGY